ncbi:aldehyde oxidase 3-like protein [Camelus ferus]|nr:aldehyde oxidase 3-like protein [Camelus ferus]
MVMSIYTLLRNHPEPTLTQLTDALGGNLCRCTGYRPIIDACKTFCKTSLKLFSEEEFLPLDPTQELIFPPELMKLAEKQPHKTRIFHGDRMTWISPVTLKELLKAKAKYPQAPVVMGNTSVGPDVKFKGIFHPVIISPDRIEELNVVNYTDNGLTLGAALSLAQVKDILANVILKLPEEKTQTYHALLKHLGTLAGSQIRNMAWEFVSAFRQAQRQQNALAIVNSGMRVFFGGGDGIIRELSISYGGVGPTTICTENSCQKLIGRPWNEEMLDAACRLILDEVSLPASAPGGKVEFKRTLIISFLFKFYLEVSQILKRMHATGEAIYCDDMPAVDQELFLAFVTSSRAHAKIVSIDLSEALSLPGVVDIVTEEDLHGVNYFCLLTKPEKLLSTEEVFCVGQLVCAVIADSEVQAKRAAKRVKIVYQDKEPLILTIEEAIQHKSFFEEERKLEYGNVEEAFKMVDQILEGEIHMGGQEHFYMETQSMLVVPKGEDQEIDVYISTQFPKYIQDIVASTLKLPANKVMCHVKRVGGAFGGKVIKTGIMAAITAFAANKHGRAVRCILERGEDMLITGGRHPYLGKYKAGFMNDGRILALDMEHYSNGGASLDESLFVRTINMYKEIDETPYKQEINAKNLIQCWKECMAMSSYALRRAAVEKFNSENYWKKKGLAMVPVKFPVGLGSTAAGQYLIVKLPQSGAPTSFSPEETGATLPKTPELVTSILAGKWGDLASTPGPGIEQLSQLILGPFKYKAAALVHIYLDGSVLVTHCGIEMGQGVHTKMIQAQAAFNESISLSATGYFRGYESDINWETGEGHPFEYFVYGAACSEVEIDCLTGAHKNIRTDIVMDVGCSINPALDIGQIEGAFIQGMGLYTIEELNYSLQGVLYTRGPNQYKIPTICDVPVELHISLLPPSQNSNTLYSSKGLGESGIFLGSSVFFAIRDAVNAARRERGLPGPLKLKSPLTPEKIRMACEDKFTKMIQIQIQIQIQISTKPRNQTEYKPLTHRDTLHTWRSSSVVSNAVLFI